MPPPRIALACQLLLAFTITSTRAAEHRADLLIVGGTESGWAAAIQAARLGVPRITIVHDGAWLGGQYTEQALACVDENKGNGKVGWGPDWHPMKRSFHRFGLFKELMDEIESFNEANYGSKMPGRPYHGPSTFRPAEAQAVFLHMLQPFIDTGQVNFITNHHPVAPIFGTDTNTLAGLVFAPVVSRGLEIKHRLTVHAPLTIDASDFGDAIQISGTEFEVGPDPHERYGEPSAPKDMRDFPPNEMNPITWAMIVEEADDWAPIPRPANFDDRNYPRATRLGRPEFKNLQWDRPARLGAIPHWPDQGKASARQLSIYSVRRIVDGYTSKDGRTAILLNYMNGQDYPLERLPRHVAAALEATEPGASRKNYVLLNRAQRRIIFEDAKRHSLGVLHHLQNFVHDRAPDKTHSFRKFRLSREFGTPDHLPPKPYIRESLRLKAMYMMREQDCRNFDSKDKRGAREAFARVIYADGVFSWQFHYDFHRTGRTYLKDEGDTGPWIDFEKPGRHTRHVSDRAVFPLRSLVPIRMNGLIGAQKNIGNSSIVSAAIRLHDHGVHIGQAAGALAATCLRENCAPREVPLDRIRLEAVREALCGRTEGSPMLLWPFRDLPADHPAFVAINRLAARGALPLNRRIVDFKPNAIADDKWKEEVVHRSLADLRFEHAPKPPANAGTKADFSRQWWAQIRQLPLRSSELPDRPWPEEVPGTLGPDTDGLVRLHKGDRAFNFSGLESRAVEPWTRDSGRIFTIASGHGWLRDISANNRRRNALPESHRDTFLFTRTSDTWECALPNGKWRVTLCVGDSGHDQPGECAWVENQPLIQDVFTATGEFHEATATVEVTDDLLTLRIGNGPGANTCVNWIVLRRHR